MPAEQTGSYIDLKNCLILLEDGYSVTGAVNNVAGYATGSTSIVVDGFTGVVSPNTQVIFAGHANAYQLVSTVETTGNTTTLVITPGLTTALTDEEVVTVGPHQLSIKVGDGNLTYTENHAREYKLNRGKIDKVRDGDEAPMEVSTTFAWTYISSATADTLPSIPEFLKRQGKASAYTTTGQGCDPYSIDIVVVNEPPTCIGVSEPVEVIRFPEFRFEQIQADAKAGTVQLSGKCNAIEPQTARKAVLFG